MLVTAAKNSVLVCKRTEALMASQPKQQRVLTIAIAKRSFRMTILVQLRVQHSLRIRIWATRRRFAVGRIQ